MSESIASSFPAVVLRELSGISELDVTRYAIGDSSDCGFSGLAAEVGEIGGATLIAEAPGASRIWLRGPSNDVRAVLSTQGGRTRIPILGEPGLWLSASASGDSGIRLPGSAEEIPTIAPLQGLDVVLQAVELGNLREAAQRLRDIAAEEGPGFRTRLVEGAATALEAELSQRSLPVPIQGRCEAPLAWRDWCGIVTISAPIANEGEPSSDLDPTLVAALARGGQLGRACARQLRGVPSGPLATAPTLERSSPIQRLRDSQGILALSAALAVCSREFEAPIPPNVIAFGGLDDEGRLQAVQSDTLRMALKAVARERPGARVLFPAGSQPPPGPICGVELQPVTTLEEAVRFVFGNAVEGPGVDVRLLDEAEVDERAYRREEALTKARSFLARGEGTPAQRLRAQWLEGACLVHLGQPEAARTAFDLAWQLMRDPACPVRPERSLAAYLALAEADGFTDGFRYADAIAALERGRELAGGADALLAKLDFFQGLVLVHAGRSEEAVVLLERASGRALPSDRPRFQCWLGLALTELGEHAEARGELEQGLMLATDVGGAARDVNRAYLLLALARLALRRLAPRRAVALAEEGLELGTLGARISPYPRSSLLHARGAGLVLAGEVETGIAALEEARGLGAVSSFMGLVCGLAELERARTLVLHEPASARAREAVQRVRALVAAYPPARERFSRELAELAALDTGAASALERLLRTLKY